MRKSSDDHFGAKHSQGSDKACTENDFIRRVKGFAGVAKASKTSSVANARDSSQKFRNSGHFQFLRAHFPTKPIMSARERAAGEKLGHEANACHCMKPRGTEGDNGRSAALRAAIERTELRQRGGGAVRAEGLSSQKASTGRNLDAAQLSWDVMEGMCTEEDEDEEHLSPTMVQMHAGTIGQGHLTPLSSTMVALRDLESHILQVSGVANAHPDIHWRSQIRKEHRSNILGASRLDVRLPSTASCQTVEGKAELQAGMTLSKETADDCAGVERSPVMLKQRHQHMPEKQASRDDKSLARGNPSGKLPTINATGVTTSSCVRPRVRKLLQPTPFRRENWPGPLLRTWGPERLLALGLASSSDVAYNGHEQAQEMYTAFKSSTLGRLEDRLDFLVDSPGFSNPAKEELAPVQRQTNHRACGSCASHVDLRLHRPRAKSVMSYFDQTQDAKELRGWQGRGIGAEPRGLGRDLKHFGISCEPQLAKTAETVRAMPARDAAPHRGRELLPMKRVGYTNIRLNTDPSLGDSGPGVADTSSAK